MAQTMNTATALVRFLLAWSSCASSLAERLKQLAVDLERARFWDERDVKLMNAWVDDLTSLGYKWPTPLLQGSPSEPGQCLPGALRSVWQDKETERLAVLQEKAFFRPSYFTLSYKDYRGF